MGEARFLWVTGVTVSSGVWAQAGLKSCSADCDVHSRKLLKKHRSREVYGFWVHTPVTCHTGRKSLQSADRTLRTLVGSANFSAAGGTAGREARFGGGPEKSSRAARLCRSADVSKSRFARYSKI